MALIFGPDTFTVAADTNIDVYPSVGAPDYAYHYGTGTDLRAIATSDRLESDGSVPENAGGVIDAAVPGTMGAQEGRCRGMMGNFGIDNEYGVLLRAPPTNPTNNTSYFGMLINRTNELEINRVNDDLTVTLLASADRGLLPDTEYTCAYRAMGSSHRLIINGETELTATDATFTTGRPGVWTFMNNPPQLSWLDDFEVDDLTTGIWSVGVGAQVASAGDQLPTFVAAGAITSGTGTITPALPTGLQVNDILVLVFETANQAVTIPTPNGGTWTEAPDSPQGTGTAGGTAASRITVFWSRYNGTQGAPTTNDPGDHIVGRMFAVRGAAASGDPWNVTAGGVDATSDTSGSIPGDTTTVDPCLVVL